MTTLASAVETDPNYQLCLDHGFVGLVDAMPSTPGEGDSAIVQAARVSYGKGTRKVSEDRGLIRYLLRHHHTTPFEMVEFKFHCKIPIFVARQWIRHRTACLAGNNILNFDLGSNSNKFGHYPISVENFFNKWHFGATESSNKIRYYEDILDKLDKINDYETYTLRGLCNILGTREGRIQQLVSKNKIRSCKVSGKRQIFGQNFKDDIKKVATEEYAYNVPLKDRVKQ